MRWWTVGLALALLLVCRPCVSIVAAQAECPVATQTEALRLRAEVEDLKQRSQWNEATERARCLVTVAGQLFGPTHATTINLQRDLASILRAAGHPSDAARIEQQVESAAGATGGGPDVTDIGGLIVQSKSLLDRGDVEGAGKVCQEARRRVASRRLERVLVFAAVLNECGRVYEAFGNYDMAEQRYTESDELASALDGPKSRQRLPALNNVGLLYWKQGEYDRALLPLQKVIEIDGNNNPDSIPTMVNLGLVYEALGREDDARGQYLSARLLTIRAYGQSHPYLINILDNLASQEWRVGRLKEAVDWQVQANAVSEHNVVSVIMLGAERQKLAYMTSFQGQTHASISLSLLGPVANRRTVQMALDVVLQRKGRILDVVADSFAAMRVSLSPQDQQIFDAWRQHNAHYATLLFRGPEQMLTEEYRALLDELQGKAQALEAQISERSPAFRHQPEMISVERVQQAIPVGAVLVEWFRYKPFIPEAKGKEPRWGTARYAAYLLKREGAPVVVDVGEAEPVETALSDLLAQLRDPQSTLVAEVARDLDERLIQPLRPYFGNAKRLLISPEGQLNLLPFGVLMDEQGHYLVQTAELTYLTSGRDLLRAVDKGTGRQPPVVFADPDFGSSDKAPVGEAPGRRSMDLRSGALQFAPLQGTAQEAQALKGILKLKDEQILTRTKASETALKALKGPRILHLATHGFFLADQTVGATAPLGENPLLRSGLALAGANRLRAGKDDGMLTALEVSGLDLAGTELAVLSACDTGIGQVQNGEGVYGLRRALVLAGVQTQVASLWKVDDVATKELMVDYYTRLATGAGRSQGLRAAQLAMLTQPKYAHPYYWAAFVVIGKDAPLGQ